MKKKKIVLFDVDYTLFDTDQYRASLYTMLALRLHFDRVKIERIGQEVYAAVRNEFGYFHPPVFAERLAKKIHQESKQNDIEKIIWHKKHFQKNMYQETAEILKKLSKKATIGIFSQGYDEFQKAKLATINYLLQKEHVHITRSKEKSLPRLVKQYKNFSLYLIDDALDVLYAAKKLNSNISVIWVKRGRFAAKQQPIKGFLPDAIIERLDKLISVIS